MTEHWLPVVGWEGFYEVSDQGRVRRVDTGKIRKCVQAGCRYRAVKLCRPGRIERKYVHVMVLEAFVGPRPDGYETDHLDFDTTNNRLTNLRWIPASMNRRRKRYNPHGKITREQAEAIRASTDRPTDIAARYGVTYGNVWLIRKGTTWR